jgi:hypothetical protein
MDPEIGEQALGRKVESLVQCLLPDAPKGWRWARLGRLSVGEGRVESCCPSHARGEMEQPSPLQMSDRVVTWRKSQQALSCCREVPE